jgi:hypothetical protein
MSWDCHRTPQYGGSAPATLGFSAVAPEWLSNGAASAAPAIPAAESTLGSHPCVALSSAQVLPEWINRNLAGNRFAANGDYPLNFVSQPRGSLHFSPPSTQRSRYIVSARLGVQQKVLAISGGCRHSRHEIGPGDIVLGARR